MNYIPDVVGFYSFVRRMHAPSFLFLIKVRFREGSVESPSNEQLFEPVPASETTTKKNAAPLYSVTCSFAEHAFDCGRGP